MLRALDVRAERKHLEADIGQATRAIVRLLGEASRHGNDPELFAGLVHACRYSGLYDEALAAQTPIDKASTSK